jgi:hypothetical protein
LKPEAERYLEKARQALNEARAVAGIELSEAAGRAAYLAAFHAAQALIFERGGKVPKTHHGVHAQFSRLAKNEPRIRNCRGSCPGLMTSRPLLIMRLGRTRPCRLEKPHPLSRQLKGSLIASASCSNDRRDHIGQNMPIPRMPSTGSRPARTRLPMRSRRVSVVPPPRVP